MANDFEVRQYKTGDEEGILKLLKRTFPRWGKRSVEYWMWKYVKSPLGIRVFVAVDGDRIIGAFCNIALRIWLEGRVVSGGYGDDTATDPDYRGKGVYLKLLEKTLESNVSQGVVFTYWQTENPIVSKTSMAYEGLVFPHRLCQLVKVKNVDLYLRSRGIDTISNKLGYTFLKGVNTFVKMSQFGEKRGGGYQIVEAQAFDEGMDSFWDKVKLDYRFILEKKASYLNWRYCSSESDRYQIILAKDGEAVLGFSVLRLTERDSSLDGTIMELLALKDRGDVAEDLIDESLRRFELQGVNSVYHQMIKGHSYQQLFESRGFIDVSIANRGVIFYRVNHKELGSFDVDSFSGYSPESIYFNLY